VISSPRGVIACFALAAIYALALPVPASSLVLGLSVSTPAGPLAPFHPGMTGSATSALTVTGLLGWTLQVADTSSASPAIGHLLKGTGASCSLGEANLTNPLTVTASGSGVTSNGPVSLSATNQTVATGNTFLAGGINISYNQGIGTTEMLESGCSYSVTVTYTAF
jgi:hypothetical protein